MNMSMNTNPLLAFSTVSVSKGGHKGPDQPGKFNVYVGREAGAIVYVGTTIQKPSDRFRWHKNNGKDFSFEVIKQCDTEQEMLDMEFDLIKLHKPKYNQITHRKQNLNRRLDQLLDSRKGSHEWCQGCLKRRVNKGYSRCYYCS